MKRPLFDMKCHRSGPRSTFHPRFRPGPFPRISPKSYRHNSVPNCFSSRFSTSPTNGLRSLSRVKVGTHSAFREGSHTRAHTAKQGCFGRGWYHYPQRTLRAAETPDGRLSKRLICRFLRSGGRSSPHDSYFLANTQNFLLAVPVANAFALWYDKFSKLEVVFLLIYSTSNSAAK